MISFRHHVFSVIAIFLALAVGLAIGAGFLGDRSSGSSDDAAELRHRNGELTAQVNSANSFADAVGARAIAGSLRDSSALIVTTPTASPDDVAAVATLLKSAGASSAGQLTLTDQFLSDSASAKLGTIVDQSIPADKPLRTELTDSGGRTGDLIGALLLTKDDAGGDEPSSTATAGLQALRQGGFVDFADGSLRTAKYVVVVTGGALPADSGARGQIVANCAAALADRAQAGVLSGRSGSADGPSPVAVVRANRTLAEELSTVDNLEQPSGRLTTVLALSDRPNGKTGAYGTGRGADSVTVAS
ncbi:copper transporter [Gordonia jinhuaensis]|uniref:Copper transport outer membrane protein, MctB n=1 Tax=Gordonia jinhuaensis TaxID=1517702 RepID=A0A916TIG4_9ACTN|nr:copper transporter [Gordonia jinhuaensis]GGB45021.1 hypothetical protein GCM10011489_35570 [Gordonia jinhuaensis]